MTGRPASNHEHEIYSRQAVFSVLFKLGGALGEAAGVLANEDMAKEINSRLKGNKDEYLPEIRKILKTWRTMGQKTTTKK